ncbi:mucin-4-like isoform X2 [Rhincodon typus]|uniref:mucin-4-like isoform X2 n=1 Tax=Rhincodon typus TaxID=259920 RepID=UPI00202F1E02|nr:mucin-4-like isoform X2 [Rhincodon typus]
MPTSTISTTTTVKSTVQTTQANITSILFEYGQDAGDQSLPKTASDVISPIFKPEIDFTFGNARYPLIYFTDNGLIVFPASATEIFNYTNPFNEFTASSVPPMIAVFWSDADISGSIGNVFYQEYKTYGSEFFNLTQNVERMISDQFKSKYKAKWTLKITWDKVPAATLFETKSKTNTYQAIITTNGSISFVLMLYESGGMNWDVSTLTSKDLLIGFSSGNGFFVNDEQTKLPTVAERFRPDKYSGKNTDLKGLRLYSLIQGTPQVNYKANCLSWFNTELNPSQWNQGLLSCPCSLPQGQADNRFRNSNLGATTKVLRSASPNANGAGQRCVYSRRNAFLEGWQERYWTSTPSDSSSQNKKFDLDPYNWCCVKVDNPLFCDYYRIRRPSINCLNYRPPTRAMMLGDPHFTTLDGLSYTFNGLGDFVLLNVESSDDTIFKLHGRTVQTGTAQATNFMAFAVQHIQDKIITVQMILKGNDSIEVLVNNDMVQFVPDSADNQEIFRNGTFYLEKNGNASVTASFGSGISLTVTAQFEMLLAITNLPEKFMNTTRGLLGVWNGNPNDDFTMPNGSVIPKNSNESTIFNYGMTWEVPRESSIFTIGRSVPNNSFTPRFLEDLQQQNETLYNLLATECKNNTQCIFDAISTGKKEIGLATAKGNTEFTEVNAMLNSYPPTITGPEVIYAQLFQQNISYYQAIDQEGNNAVFIPYISQELNVTENGTLIWHPKTTNGISFEIEAIGYNNLSSVLRPQLVLCNCSVNGECINNEITQINGSSVYKAACNCTAGFTGTNCQDKIEICQVVSCFPGVDCSSSGCGSCPRGLAGNGIRCIDIDECNSNNSCSPNATCTNIVQSYNCTCNSGFSGNGTSCNVINPCDSSPCSPNADCTNTAGHFSCTCKERFTGNGTSCSVINPCDSSPCSPNADCTNTAGHFSCTCKEGFTGNGTSCNVINPCDSSPCSPNADCTNTAGNFSCTCKDGFTGNGTICLAVPCFNFTCPSPFCNNGGTCVPNLADGCKPLCQCPSQYKGERCTSPEQQFIAQPLSTLPKRSVNITLKLPNVNVTVLKNRSSTDYRTLSTVTASRLLDFLGKVRHFAENLEAVFWSQGDIVTTAVVSLFNYNGNRTVIDFLNNELHDAILEAFNGKQRFTRALYPDNFTFGNLNAADIQDITKLSYEKLLPHFSCNNTEFAGYEVLWDDQNGVICQSPCEMNYCLNQGECKHLITGPVCKCVPRTIYSSYGDRCEHLSMNLRAFFGILFGALAFLFLLMLAIFFIIWKCKKPGRERLINDTTSFGDTTFSFKSNPLSSKLKTTHILPSLGDKDVQSVAWTPNFDAVKSTAEVKIARPSVKKNGTDSEIP